MRYKLLKIVALFSLTPLLAFCCQTDEPMQLVGEKENAGIPGIETGVLSVKHQSLLYDNLEKVFKSPEHRNLETIIKTLAPNGNYIKRTGEDGIDRYSFTFYSLEEEVEKLSLEFSKIKYLAGVIVLYRDNEYLGWLPRYVTRFRGLNDESVSNSSVLLN